MGEKDMRSKTRMGKIDDTNRHTGTNARFWIKSAWDARSVNANRTKILSKGTTTFSNQSFQLVRSKS